MVRRGSGLLVAARVVLDLVVLAGRGEENHPPVEIQRPAGVVLAPRTALVALVLELPPREQFAVLAHNSTVAALRPAQSGSPGASKGIFLPQVEGMFPCCQWLPGASKGIFLSRVEGMFPCCHRATSGKHDEL